MSLTALPSMFFVRLIGSRTQHREFYRKEDLAYVRQPAVEKNGGFCFFYEKIKTSQLFRLFLFFSYQVSILRLSDSERCASFLRSCRSSRALHAVYLVYEHNVVCVVCVLAPLVAVPRTLEGRPMSIFYFCDFVRELLWRQLHFFVFFVGQTDRPSNFFEYFFEHQKNTNLCAVRPGGRNARQRLELFSWVLPRNCFIS